MGSGGMIPGGGPGGNIWNLGGPGGSSNVWPGSGMSSSGGGGNSGSGSGKSSGFDWEFTAPSHGRYAPLLGGDEIDFGGGGFNNGGFNGLGLSGTWASSGFGAQHGPSSGFNFYNPSTGGFSPSGSNFSPFPANGIGSIPVNGVQNPSMPFSFNGGSTGNGFPSFPGVDAKSLDKIYGKGVGTALSKFLSSGAGFNPGVVQALFNQAAPIEARTLSKMQTMFGDSGNAYSSTAAIGYGDFESQFNAALEGIVAQEYQQSVQNYLNVLMGVKGDAKESHAQGANLLSIASEIARSIIPFFG